MDTAATTNTAAGPDSATQQTADDQAQQQSQQGSDAADQQGSDESGRDLSRQPQWVQELVSSLRREAGDARMNAKTTAAEEARKELANEVGKALGLVKDGEVDPKQLIADAEANRKEALAAQRELAVFRLSGKAGADPDALLDSNAFLRSIDGLDPKDEGKITEAIKAAVQGNARLSATPRAGSRSGNDSGGSGEKAITKEAFDKMSGAEKNQLFVRDPDAYARLSAD